MIMMSERKIRKGDDDDGIDIKDFISRLPDVVLGDILSLLPTKEAVATSVLSKRWRRAYTWVTRLDFDHTPIAHCVEHPYWKNSFPVFRLFVEKVLCAHYKSDVVITAFRLHFGKVKCHCMVSRCVKGCYPCLGAMQLDSWICYPLSRRVRELDISAHVQRPGVLPPALFTCETLEVLKLKVNLDLELPSSPCLPHLKVLHLALLFFPEDDSLTRLVSSCPSLEHLDLYGRSNPANPIKISSPSLRRLAMNFLISFDHKRRKLTLDVPNLEYLLYEDVCALDYSIGGLNALVEAQVDTVFICGYDGVENLLDLVSSLLNVESLFMMTGCVSALSECDIKHKLPVFRNLKHLNLGCECYIHWNKLLMDLLSFTPLLETLAFPGGIADFSEDNEEYEEMSELECQSWSTTETVPSCVRFHLKRIVIMYFEGIKWKLELVKYFMKNASVLEELVVSCFTSVPLADRKSLESTLQKLSRGSATCSIKVD